MKKILSILTVGCALTLSSCEDWLDKYPLAQMSPETFFSNENELQAFSNTFYNLSNLFRIVFTTCNVV